MKIKLVYPEQEADFIRHARAETLKSIGEEPTAAAIEPAPFGYYLIAYVETAHGDRPIGMAEIAFHSQIYKSFTESVYPDSIHLDRFCPIDDMAGIRTIYVEPDYRHKAGALYMQLIQAGGQVVVPLGARFASATTNAADTYLNKLYVKTGGKPMGAFSMNDTVDCEVSLYVFDINKLMNHKLMARATAGAKIEIAMQVAGTLKSRNLWNLDELKCA